MHAFAWFRNRLHQNNAPCLISLFNKNTDVNVNSITGTPVSHQYSAWRKKLNLSLKHRNCGHIKGRSWRSIQFGDNHVVCATKVIFNCIIQPINSWKKITRKFTFIGLAVQGITLRQILSRHNNKNIFKGTAKKTKTNYLWIVLNYAMWNCLIFYYWYLIPYSVSVSVSVSMIPFPFPDSRFPIPDSRFPIPDSRFPIPDSRFPIPDSRFPILVLVLSC